ncbi:MAG: hypothetical protein ACK476_11750, partial [Fluviicola sp.]
MKIIFLIILSIVIKNYSFSQSEKCDTIYSNPDSLAVFSGGSIGLREFVFNELLTVIQLKCNNEIEKISSLKIRFTINSFGEVIDAKIIQSYPDDLSEDCKNEICLKAKY